MKDCKKIEEMKEELKQSPIFAMSLSSKELFHSNFWEWLFERNVEYIKIFFEDFEYKGDVEKYGPVKREDGHRDITIWQCWDGKNKLNNAYIIENKFKSLPDKAQLERYQSKVKESNKIFCKGVITGIVKPTFVDSKPLSDWWSFKSYKEIGEKIKECAQRIEKDEFEKELITKYAEMIIHLHNILVSAISTKDKSLFLSNEAIDLCKDLRIYDVLQKLKASEFVEYLDKDLRNNQEIAKNVNGYSLSINSDFGNSASINILYKKENDELNIQIAKSNNGWVYRWCVGKDEKFFIGNTKEVEAKLNEFFAEYINKGWFVDYKENLNKNSSKYKKRIKNHIGNEMLVTSQSKPYCVFDCTKTEHIMLICQYWNIQEGEKYSNIINRIKQDMKLAQDILEKQ